MTRVLVFGATGYIGTHLIPRLVDAGHTVRATARSREVLEGRNWESVEVTAADALVPESLDEVLTNIDVAYYLIHSRGSGKDFYLLDMTAARNFRMAAERSGVKRIISLNVLPAAKGESPFHHASRQTWEQLSAGPIPVTELRVGAIIGPGSVVFEVARGLAYHARLIIATHWMRSKVQPIALPDLVEYLVGVLTVPETIGRRFDVVGYEITDLRALVRHFANRTSRSPWFISLPVSLPWSSSHWLALTTGVPINVGRPLIDGISHDLVVKDTPIRNLLPIPLQTVRDAIDESLANEKRMPIPARWTEGALPFRDYHPEFSFYAKRTGAEIITDTSIEALWDQIASIGGDNGWYYMTPLWELRGAMDTLIGGVGMRRGRRHPRDIRVGDTLDFYRVIAANPNQNLTLAVEMKLPGSAIMEFELEPMDGQQTRLSTTAYFHPSGIFGQLYWYALLPIHMLIFKGLTRNIIRRASSLLEQKV